MTNSNPAKFYLQICRQLQYEIGEIYSEMTDFKIAVAEKEGLIDLTSFSINYRQKFTVKWLQTSVDIGYNFGYLK